MNFSYEPLRRFAALIDKLAPGDMRNSIDVKLLGPANSTGLLNMVREVRRETLSPETQETLNGVTIVSPRATASDLTLLYKPTAASGSVPVRSDGKSVKELLESAVQHDPLLPVCILFAPLRRTTLFWRKRSRS